MTNEEAKKLLQNNLDFENGKKGIYPCPIEQYKLALEVAIEALQTHDKLCENLTWYINERQRLLKVIEYSKPNEGLQRTIQKALERPHGEWIPVAERLPPHSERIVLATVVRRDKTWNNDSYHRLATYINGKWYPLPQSINLVPCHMATIEQSDGGQAEVIAWMPLPEPYKAESEE